MPSVQDAAVWLHCLLRQEIMMPTYDFKCNFCGTTVESKSNVPDACGLCGETMVRLWSATPVHFKSTGFYSTGG
jgi:putative FmdB family regulatory protein